MKRVWEKFRSIECIITKAVPVHAMLAYAGSTGIAPLILDLDTRGGGFSD
jgi:hypothetical protein